MLAFLQVGPRAVWKDMQHPLRHHSSLQLTGIPTLVHWEGNTPTAKLGPELEAATSTQEADDLIRQFVSQHDTHAHARSTDSTEAVDIQALMQQLQISSVQNGTK